MHGAGFRSTEIHDYRLVELEQRKVLAEKLVE
jgi:hypothetical protein